MTEKPSWAVPQKFKQNATCMCGSIKFVIEGTTLLNGYCHCRACTRIMGVSPVHIIGIAPRECVTFKTGSQLVKTVKGFLGDGPQMMKSFCSECGSTIYSRPDGENFVNVYPTTFWFNNGVNLADRSFDEVNPMPRSNGSFLLPDELKPMLHINYENRQKPFIDGLPKFKDFPWISGLMMDASGEVIHGSPREGASEAVESYADRWSIETVIAKALESILKARRKQPFLHLAENFASKIDVLPAVP